MSDIDKGYTLNPQYKIRYFAPDENLPRMLKGMRKFLKENKGIRGDSVAISNRYDYEIEEIVFEGTLTYLGETN